MFLSLAALFQTTRRNVMNTETKLNQKETLNDEELSNLASFGPTITVEQLIEIEQVASSNSCGMSRRLALLACMKSAEFSKLNAEEPEALKEMLDNIEAFKEHVQGLTEIAETAYFRMLLAGCRQETIAH